MGLLERVASPKRRYALLGTLTVLSMIAVVVVWTVGHRPWVAMSLALIAVAVVGSVKGLLELATRQRAQMSRHTEINSRLKAVEGTLAGLRAALDKQSRLVAESRQRVGELESVAKRQEGFNDAVLDRVRAVESAGRRQEGFNDAVLDRVRVLERNANQHITESMAAIEDLAAKVDEARALLESIHRYRDHGAGTHIELRLADELKRLRSSVGSDPDA